MLHLGAFWCGAIEELEEARLLVLVMGTATRPEGSRPVLPLLSSLGCVAPLRRFPLHDQDDPPPRFVVAGRRSGDIASALAAPGAHRASRLVVGFAAARGTACNYCGAPR